MYVASDGDARVWLNGSNGTIWSSGNHYVGGNRVLTTGDEGSGNGIDADTVDGLQSSSFLRSDATDTLTSGSALQFQTSAGNTRGFLQATETNNAHFIIATSGGEDISFRDGGLSGSTNMTIRGDGVLLQGTSNTIWHAGNDGSGSGLDADNLDGYTWTSGTNAIFSRIEFTGVGGNSGNGVHNYAIYQEGGGWSNPYPDLVIGYHTGVKIGGHYNYNGTRFYNDAPGRSGASMIFSVGNGDSNVRVTNNLYIGGNIAWHAGNDGAGSGLDADNLDGKTWNSSGKDLRGTEIYADNWFRNYNAGEGLYNQATGCHFVSDSSDQWCVRDSGNSIRIEFKTNGTSRRGAVYADNAPSIGFLNTSNEWGLRYLSNNGNSPNLYFREEGNETWTGNPGNDMGKIEYHSNRFYIAAGANSTELVRFRRGGTNVAYIDNSGNIYSTSSNHKVWTAGNDGSGSGLDADTVDGYHGSALANNTHTTHSASNLAAGWYTIATNSGSRAIARFGLRDVAGGRHQSIVFYASHHYGSRSEISIHHNSRYSGHPLRYIRIREGGTYDGAMLQVYIDDASNSVTAYLLGDNFQSSGWVLKDWVPAATNPGGVSNFGALTNTYCQVDINQTLDGGITTTGEIYAGGNTTQYKVWHQGNDGSGSGLDADNLDGYTWGSSGKNVRATEFYADNWFRNYNSGEGLYNQATQMHWYSDTSSRFRCYSTSTTSQILFTTNGNNARGYVYADNSNNIGFLDSDGSWAVRVVRDAYVELRDNNEVTFRAGQGGVDGDYGTVQTHGNGKGGWEGYSINGRYVFMSADNNSCGWYNDVNNRWIIYHARDDRTDHYDPDGGNVWFRMDNGEMYSYIHNRFTDNDEIRLGNGADFRMWHNGSHHYFRNYNHGSGNIYWQGEDDEGSNHALLYMYTDGSRPYLRLYENGGERLRTTSDGVTVYGNVTSTSDERYKKNIERIDDALNKIDQLEGITFDWDNDAFPEGDGKDGNATRKPDFDRRATGVIAQKVEKVLPEAVSEDSETGMKNVAYGNMIGLIVEGIKEINEKLSSFEDRLSKLEDNNDH